MLNTILTAALIGMFCFQAGRTSLTVWPIPGPAPAPTPVPVPDPSEPAPKDVDYTQVGKDWAASAVSTRSKSFKSAASQVAAGVKFDEAVSNISATLSADDAQRLKSITSPLAAADKDTQAAALKLVAAGFLVEPDNPDPPPNPKTDFEAIGKAYGPTLTATYAAAWEKAATALESGTDIVTALKAISNDWQDGRTKSYNATIGPALNTIATDPNLTDDQRKAVVAAWRDLAKGLREGGSN